MRKCFIGITVFLLLLILFYSPAFCSDAEKSEGENSGAAVENMNLGEVVITAMRVKSSLSEAPMNISVITKDDIEESNAKTVAELLGELEGVHHYDPSGVGSGSRINLRGFWGGMSSHTLVLVDGIPQNAAGDKLVDWSMIPLENVEKIEISRGPASSVYGENAMGGVINIFMKKGYGENRASLKTSYSSFNSLKFSLSNTGQTRGGNRYSLGVVRNKTDGFRDKCEYEDFHLNTGFDLETGVNSDMSFSMQYSHSERGAYPWALTRALVNQDRTQARPGTENDEGEEDKVLVSVGYHADTARTTSMDTLLYVRKDRGESFYTSSSTGNNTKENLEDEYDIGGSVIFTYRPVSERLEHFVTAGIDLEHGSFDYQSYSAPSNVRGAIQDDYSAKRNKIGIFIEDEIAVGNRLKVTAGVRYDNIKDRFSDFLDNTNSANKSQSSFNPRLGLARTISRGDSGGSDSVLFANVSKAFRTPTMGQLFTYSSANLDLNPEKAVNFEIGVRHGINRDDRINLALYRMNVKNEIWYDSSAKLYKNYGKTAHTGVELRYENRLNNRMELFADHTYSIAKKKSGTDSGNYLESVPKHMGRLGLKYKNPSGWGLDIAADVIGPAYLDSSNSAELPGFVTMDIAYRNEYRSGSITVGIENILDKNYYSSGYKTSSGTEYLTPAPGRTFSIGMNIRM